MTQLNRPISNARSRIVEDYWREYAQRFISPTASDEYRHVCRQVFYSGCEAMLAISMTQLGTASQPTTKHLLALAAVGRELDEYKEAYRAGKV